MALDAKNIAQGAGRLYIATVGDALPTFNTTGGSVKNDFEASAAWRDLGYTSEGVEVAYTPTYTDIVVDQLKDAARVFLETETMTYKTNLMEATLENLILAWGRNEGNDLVRTDATNATFSIGVGPDVACEYKLAIVVPGPGSVNDCDGLTSVVVERIYVAERVVSVEGSTHSLRRTEAVMFPVSFRCLPYDQAAAGQEYGQIIDREVQSV